jgi:hypothetical protein
MMVTPGGTRIASPFKYTSLRLSDNAVPLVYGPSKGGRAYSVYQVLEGWRGSLRLLTDDGSTPVISPDGRFVAWQLATSADGYARVAGWDVERRTPLAHTVTFPFKPTCCDNPLTLNAVDNQGRVFATGGGVAWLAPLRSGGRVAPIQGLRRWYYIESVAGDGLILTSNRRAVVGRLRSRTFIESQTRIGGAAGGSFSATGGSLAYHDRDGGVRVRDSASGDVQTIAPPPGGRFGPVTWEDSTHVLLETVVGETGRRTAWVRCSVDVLDYEIALPPGRTYTFPF